MLSLSPLSYVTGFSMMAPDLVGQVARTSVRVDLSFDES